MQRPSTIATWNRNPADEEAMGAAHAPIWRRMIDVSVPHDLHDSTILDYGCNQGGFLRMLYDRHPFRGAVGIDIARESVARADLLKGQRPIEYKVGDKAAALGRTFDFAFSHEVLYLLPDLAQHANDMKAALRPGGAYVAAMGCHTDSAVWSRWRKADRRELVDPDLRPFARRGGQGLLRGGLHRGGAPARPRRLHAGDGGQRVFSQGRRPAALLQPGQGAVPVRAVAVARSYALAGGSAF